MWEVVLDALLDTLKLFPFLFLLYILIELMEHNTGVGKPRQALTGKYAPLLGAGLGVVPMCGFSVMAAKLYEHRHVTVGTLLAVFITTSDEALLVLLLSDMGIVNKLIAVALLVGVKFTLAVACGYLVDALFRKKRGSLAPLPEVHNHDHEHEHDHEEAHEEGDCECAELSPCEHKKENKVMMYLVSPLLHALQVAAFVFLVTLCFGALVYSLGEENVLHFMQGTAYWIQPLVCALIGAIPNCASSVVLAEAYALGGIGFGGLLAGLVVNAGLGYVILLRKERRRGLIVLAGMLLLGIAAGYVAGAITFFI